MEGVEYRVQGVGCMVWSIGCRTHPPASEARRSGRGEEDARAASEAAGRETRAGDGLCGSRLAW